MMVETQAAEPSPLASTEATSKLVSTRTLGATMLLGLREIEEIVVPIILDGLSRNRPSVVGGNRALS
jgi:hypothetical protein